MPKPSTMSGGAMRVAQHALAVAKSAQKAPEEKYFQFSSQTTNYLAGVSTVLTSVAQGVGQAQRVGDKLQLRRVRLRGKFYSLTPSNTTFRVALVRSVGGGVPAVTDVWTSDDTQSQRNRSLDDIYQILKEETITLNDSFLNGDCAAQLDWDLSVNRPVWFAAGATTNERGGLYLVVTNDLADAASSITKPAIGDTGSIWRVELAYTDE